MPRSIDGIVASHQAARSLRAQGKPIWSGQVQLKDLLTNDDVKKDDVVEIAHEMAARIRKSLDEKFFDINSDDYDDDLTMIVEDMEIFHASNLGDDAQEVLNERLDEFYDWADHNRIWVS